MAVYVNQPTLAVDFMAPGKIVFDTPGAGIEGGRNGLGESITIGFSGGPVVVAAYERCFVHDPEQYEYVNWLGARLNGGFRFINVPLITDWMGPFPQDAQGVPQPIVTGVTHSDGSTFSDGSGYSQATVYGEFTASAALNAGEISIQVFGASRALRWSDWFSVLHSVKGWRVYRYWEVRNVVAGENPVYTLAISPPLRQAVSAGERVEFARPRCVMKFPRGYTLPVEAEEFWFSRPTLQFTEAF